jgi:competence protein ComEC
MAEPRGITRAAPRCTFAFPRERPVILVWLAAAFVGGVAAGSNGVRVSTDICLAVAAASAFAAWFVRQRRPVAYGLLVLLVLALGVARVSAHPGGLGRSDLSWYNGRSVHLTGVVSQEPDVRDSGTNYVVSASSVTVAGHAHSASGSVLVHLPSSEELNFGDTVQLVGRLSTPASTQSFDYRGYLARRGIFSTMAFVGATDLGPAPGDIGFAVVRLRVAIERSIDAWLPEPEASLLIAITLGARSSTLGGLAPALVATGLIHIIAISGIKVAMVAGTIFELAALTRRRLLRVVLASLVLLAYVAITGFTPSGLRSAVMWELVFLAFYLGRTTVALVSLGSAAAVMVAVDPTLLFDTGFQMSVVGTFAIVAFAPYLTTLCRYVPSPFREALAVTVAAQVGTLPIVASSFGLTSLVGPVANALVLPLVPLSIAVGFLLPLVASVPAIATPVSDFAIALIRLEIGIARALSSFPDWHLAPAYGRALAIAYYVGLASLSLTLLHRAGWAPTGRYASRARELGLATFAALVAASLTVLGAHGSTQTRLQWLGTGEALLLTTAHHAVLIDGSPHSRALLARLGSGLPDGTRRLDLVIVTDPRASNIAGLRAVLQRYAVTEVLDVGAQYPSRTYARWRHDARALHISLYALRTRTQVAVDGVRIDALDPDALCPTPVDCSSMLAVTTGRQRLLLPGSASLREQREALFRSVDLRATLVVDGSPAPLDSRFLRGTSVKKGDIIRLPVRQSTQRAGADRSPVPILPRDS